MTQNLYLRKLMPHHRNIVYEPYFSYLFKPVTHYKNNFRSSAFIVKSSLNFMRSNDWAVKFPLQFGQSFLLFAKILSAHLQHNGCPQDGTTIWRSSSTISLYLLRQTEHFLSSKNVITSVSLSTSVNFCFNSYWDTSFS